MSASRMKRLGPKPRGTSQHHRRSATLATGTASNPARAEAREGPSSLTSGFFEQNKHHKWIPEVSGIDMKMEVFIFLFCCCCFDWLVVSNILFRVSGIHHLPTRNTGGNHRDGYIGSGLQYSEVNVGVCTGIYSPVPYIETTTWL